MNNNTNSNLETLSKYIDDNKNELINDYNEMVELLELIKEKFDCSIPESIIMFLVLSEKIKKDI